MSDGATGQWRRWRWLLVGTVVLVAAFGHALFWYLPRERSVRPRLDDAPYRLWSGASEGHRLWLAHPHQSHLGRTIVRLALPNLTLPPAREVAIVVDRDRTTVAARLYPMLRFVAVVKDKGVGWVFEEIGGKPSVLKV